MKKTKKNKITGIVRLVLIAICGGILGFNLYSANANKLVGNKLPMPFGYGWAVVLTGSMEPSIQAGDLIIVSEDKPYDTGDTVVYQQGGMLVVHRVVEIKKERRHYDVKLSNKLEMEFSLDGKLLRYD